MNITLSHVETWHLPYRNCPRCKTLRRATKKLSLSRLPPVLLIHLKRFSIKGPFTDKLETFVDFPMTGLDLTNHMPPPLPPGLVQSPKPVFPSDDPRSQAPPYRYDLYAVTNHLGTLSSGHCAFLSGHYEPCWWTDTSRSDTAFIKSRGNWLYFDDSRVTQADAKEVVVCFLRYFRPSHPHLLWIQGRPAYVLFYKRTKS